MLRQEEVIVEGRTLVKTYSDAGMYVRQIETGVLYDSATDVPGRYTYEESDVPLDDDITPEEALAILMGEE